MSPAVLQLLLDEVGPGAARWVAAVGRVLPVALIVPAFGAGFLPFALRVALSFALVLGVAPVTEPVRAGPLALVFVVEALRGVPVALTAAAALWACGMAGGLAGELFHGQRSRGASSLEKWFTIFAAAAFFQLGGPARLVAALTATRTGSTLAGAVADVAAGIGYAVAIAAPLLVTAVVVDVGRAFIVRETPAFDSLAASVRSLFILVALAVFFERVAELAVLLQAR